MVRILIADDHVLIRQAVRGVVEQEPDLEVVAEAGNGQEAVLRAAEVLPDVVLMDLAMPVCDGFEATERVLACSPDSRVVIFSASHHEQ
ncbi:MAG TPA: response regulator transcription factor, partial [Ktedonobacteraceae bacterium]|nr:response regulator transcription factor [Ktedonobacteraceae bacterium]